MRLGVIADDFTGASDIALTLAEGGMRTIQYVGVPTAEVPAAEAGVVALKSRTIPAAEAVARALSACDWLLGQGAEQIVFKVCSTFDSTPAGNIGPVAEALAGRLGESHVLVCPAFPEAGRSVYLGHLFVGDRLVSETGMADHPLTPMRDPDLRRVLAAQSTWPVAHVPAAAVWAEAIDEALPEGPALVIVDAIRDADLRAIGRAAETRRLVVGGSGIALGLPEGFGFRPRTPPWQPVRGPGAILSGSCSETTRGQVAAFAGPRRELTAEAAMAGLDADELADWALAQDAPPLLYSSAGPGAVAAAQARFGRERLSATLEGLAARLAAALVERGVRRLVVTGGETAGAAVGGLGLDALAIGPRLAPGVPMMRAGPLALALKSGNFGGPAFFAEALARMERT